MDSGFAVAGSIWIVGAMVLFALGRLHTARCRANDLLRQIIEQHNEVRNGH